MGFADLLVWLGIPYDSEEGVSTGERVMEFVEAVAREASVSLAERRGAFPSFPGSIYDRPGGRRQRNATLTTIAPTGTLSILADCSGGIEPLFALAFRKRVFGGVQLAQEVHPALVAVARRRGFYSDELVRKVAERGSVRGLPDVPPDVQRVFVTAMDIAPEWHVRMEAAFQRHVDNAVSKTINLPQAATQREVRDAFRLAYQLGCKGITVYRYGSRPAQVLSLQGYCVACAGEDGPPGEVVAAGLPA
jgi:ribonucleoside-diphosphate reductase alpha chain